MSAGISSAELLTRTSFQSQGLAEMRRHSSSNGVASELTRSLSKFIASPSSPSIQISAHPFRSTSLDPHGYAECADSNTTHISEAFAHAFENARTIIAPLVLIIAADKIAGGRPVFVFDRVEKVFRVTPDLSLGPPEPDEIQPDAEREGQTAVKSSPK